MEGLVIGRIVHYQWAIAKEYPAIVTHVYLDAHLDGVKIDGVVDLQVFTRSTNHIASRPFCFHHTVTPKKVNNWHWPGDAVCALE